MQETVEYQHPAPQTARQTTAAPRRWRRWMIAAFAATLLLAVLAGGLWIGVRMGSGETKPAPSEHKDGLDPRDPPPLYTNKLGMKLVWIKPGTFLMGSPKNEEGRDFTQETRHQVTLTKGFYISATLVTQWQWEEIMDDNPSSFKCRDDDEKKKMPVNAVTWDECQEFCKKLSARDKQTYWLPTEAQWEYACRAGTRTAFWWGNTISTDQANYTGARYGAAGVQGENRDKPTPVDHFKPNPWGLHDMHGNLWQWCEDWFNPYPADDITDPIGSKGKDDRHVLRGGSYRDAPSACRAAYRYAYAADYRGVSFGCRVVLCLE